MADGCPRCGSTKSSPDIVDNQRVIRCGSCGRRLAAGDVLPREAQAQPLSFEERYRPTSTDGLTRSRHTAKRYRTRSGFTTLDALMLLVVLPLLLFVAVVLHWI
jgi:hypothetical protein